MPSRGFTRGVRGHYPNASALAPFYQGRTVGKPPSSWVVTPDLRVALFSGLKDWLVEWRRKYLVGKDEAGSEVYSERVHYFVRCSRCKQRENWEHFIAHESGLIGPFCPICVTIVIDESLTDVAGQVADVPIYYLSTNEKSLNGILDALLAFDAPVRTATATEASDLF